MSKPAKVIPQRFGIDGYDVYLDSPLGYVFQARFDTEEEADAWAEENDDSLWRVTA